MVHVLRARIRPVDHARIRAMHGRVALAVALLLGTVGAGCIQPSAVPPGAMMMDTTGTMVSVGDLDRIVATSVDIVEIVILLGHGDRLVGAPAWIESSSGCIEVPRGAESLDRFGRPHVISAEEVLGLAPTLVLEKPFPLSPTPLADNLRRVGVPVFVFDAAETIDAQRATYEALGDIFSTIDPDAKTNAEALWETFEAELDAATEPVHRWFDETPEIRARAVFQFPSALVGADGTSASLLLRLAGAVDLASEAGLSGYRQISAETLVAGDPERVVVTCTAATDPRIMFGAPRYADTTAARRSPDSLLVVDPSRAGLIGPRFPGAVRDVAEWLYPAAYDLLTPRLAHEWQADESGWRLLVDADGTTANATPWSLRLDPGDGREVIDADDAQASLQIDYARLPSAAPVVLLRDGLGRVHTEPLPLPPE